MMYRTISELQDFAARASLYQQARREYAEVPARKVLNAVREMEGGCVSLKEAICYWTTGHHWSSGYDDNDREVMCYCLNCGACGDC